MIDKTIQLTVNDGEPIHTTISEAFQKLVDVIDSFANENDALAAELNQLREFVGAEKALADLAQDVCDVFCPVNEREELAYRKLREALRPYTEAK